MVVKTKIYELHSIFRGHINLNTVPDNAFDLILDFELKKYVTRLFTACTSRKIKFLSR